MNGNFLIPANSKKSLLILGLFTQIDLVIFLVGLGMTLLLMMIVDVSTLVNVIIVITPLLVASFLDMPIPNYHNMRVIIQNIYSFYTTRQRFIWKGWCFEDDSKQK